MNKHYLFRRAADLTLLLFVSMVRPSSEAFGATLSVTPSVISNTYPGMVQLDIGGLTNGEPVMVQKWLDLNGNGSIDAGEMMIDVFKIADGGAMVIGGVTNISAPYDSNPVGGAIT